MVMVCHERQADTGGLRRSTVEPSSSVLWMNLLPLLRLSHTTEYVEGLQSM